jgi:hypothetical protein
VYQKRDATQKHLKFSMLSMTRFDQENNAELRRDVKNVMEVIIGLLKDRVKVDDAPDNKRTRTK